MTTNRLIALALLLSLATACSKDEKDKTPTPIPANRVGPAGRTMVIEGVKLVFPAGAVTEDVDITVEKVGESGTALFYQFGPEGLRFEKPVEVTVPVAPGATEAFLYWTAYKELSSLVEQEATFANDTLTARIDHFSGACSDHRRCTREAPCACVSFTVPAQICLVCDRGGSCFNPNEERCTAEVCGDQLDNDGDGLFDCDDTVDCCGSTFCDHPLSPCVEDCNNGVDDDGDGNVDCADTWCTETCNTTSGEHCTDGMDNDGDNLVDCADAADCCADPACTDDPSCTAGDDCLAILDCAYQCGADPNDATAPDPACLSACREAGSPGGQAGFDPLVTCAASPKFPNCILAGDCSNDEICSTAYGRCANPQEICTNSTDDDGDNLTDCADPDCAADPACNTGGCVDDAFEPDQTPQDAQDVMGPPPVLLQNRRLCPDDPDGFRFTTSAACAGSILVTHDGAPGAIAGGLLMAGATDGSNPMPVTPGPMDLGNALQFLNDLPPLPPGQAFYLLLAPSAVETTGVGYEVQVDVPCIN